MRSLSLLLGLAVTLLLAACGTPPERRLDAPALSVAGLSPSGGDTVLTLHFINPNTAPLVVEKARHTLYIGSEQIGRIKDQVPVGIPALGGVTRAVPVPASLASEISAYKAGHPQAASLAVESELTVAIEGSDTITLKTSGAGPLK